MTDKKDIQTVSAAPARRKEPAEAISPLVDIHEDEHGTTYLAAEVPGATMDGIDIRVDKGVLTISAEAAPRRYGDEYTRTYVGFETDTYFRAFALSDEIDRERIEASLTDGVLTLTLPRAAAAQTRKIEIKSG